MRTIWTWMARILSIAVTFPAAAGNILQNGTLDRPEGAVPAGWQLSPDSGWEYGEKTRLSEDRVLHWRPRESAALLTQSTDVPVTSGQSLKLHCDWSHRAGKYQLSWQLQWQLETHAASTTTSVIPAPPPSGDWQRLDTIVKAPEHVTRLTAVTLAIQITDPTPQPQFSIDNLEAIPVTAQRELALAARPPFPALSGSEMPLSMPHFNVPAARPLRILAVAAPEQPIIQRILNDFATAFDAEVDLIQGNRTDFPQQVRQRFSAGDYQVIWVIGQRSETFLNDPDNTLRDAVSSGTGIVFLGEPDGHPGLGTPIWQRGEEFPDIPMAEISPDTQEMSRYGLQSISSGTYGKGTVIEVITRERQFYRHGIWPAIDETTLSEGGVATAAGLNFDYYNYYMSLFAKLLYRAAGLEPEIRFDWQETAAVQHPGDTIRVALAGNDSGAAMSISATLSRQGIPTAQLNAEHGAFLLPESLPGGNYMLDARVYNAEGKVVNWSHRAFRVIPRSGPAIAALTASQRAQPDQPLTGTLQLTQIASEAVPVTLSLTDSAGRLLATRKQIIAAGTDTAEFALSFPPEQVLLPLAWLQAELPDAADARRLPIFFPWHVQQLREDFRVAADLWIPLQYRGALAPLLHEIGINTINCWLPGSFQAALDGFPWIDGWGGVVGDNAATVAAALQEMGAHGRTAYTDPERKHWRNGCLSSPDWRRAVEQSSRLYRQLAAPNPPLTYMFCDEMTLAAPWSGHHDPNSEPCRQPDCLKRFRDELRQRYRDIEHLNAAWDRNFSSFDAVTPDLTDEARGRGNFAGWLEFRTFMDRVFADAVAFWVAQFDDGENAIATGQPNWTWLTPTAGIDPSLLVPVRSASQDYGPAEVVRSFRRPGAPLWPWIGYSGSFRDAATFRSTVWRSIQRGATGMVMYHTFQDSVDDPEGFLHPLLGRCERTDYFTATVTPLTEGLGLLFNRTPRETPVFGMLYSQASMGIAWLKSSDPVPFSWEIRNRRDADSYNSYFRSQEGWKKLIRSRQQMFDYTDEKALQRSIPYPVLILPSTFALAPASREAILRYAQNGGIVIADWNTARYDTDGRPTDASFVRELFGLEVSGEPGYRHTALQLPSGTVELPLGAPLRLVGESRVHGKFSDGTPALIEHRYGKGVGIYLNTLPETRNEIWRALDQLLDRYGIQRDFTVTRNDGAPALGVELTEYRTPGSEGELVILTGEADPEIQAGQSTSPAPYDGPLCLQWAQPRFVHNILTGESYGMCRELYFEPRTGATVLAFTAASPEPWNFEWRQSPAPGTIGRGVIRRESDTAGIRVLSFRLYHDNQELPVYRKHVAVSGKEVEVTVPLPLNFPSGNCRLIWTDVVTGQTIEQELTLP